MNWVVWVFIDFYHSILWDMNTCLCLACVSVDGVLSKDLWSAKQK